MQLGLAPYPTLVHPGPFEVAHEGPVVTRRATLCLLLPQLKGNHFNVSQTCVIFAQNTPWVLSVLFTRRATLCLPDLTKITLILADYISSLEVALPFC